MARGKPSDFLGAIPFQEKILTSYQPQGPKLGKFKDGNHGPIQFVRGIGSGAHSHVWEVKIDGVTYALKMFRHIRAEEENAASPARLQQFGVDLQLLNDQLTPFNCEARAYGRLHETGGSEDIAWGCDGYVALGEAEYGAVVWDTIRLERKDWFSQYINTDAEVADRPVFPIYALVKEFITDAGRLGALDITKAHDMAQAINRLHSIGITHRDGKCPLIPPSPFSLADNPSSTGQELRRQPHHGLQHVLDRPQHPPRPQSRVGPEAADRRGRHERLLHVR